MSKLIILLKANNNWASTVKKTMYDMNLFQRFLDECGEKRRIIENTPGRELKKQGKGNKPNATVALINEDIERIFDENQFGT